jgi:predicted N-acetyltransferase YhbS
MVLARVAVDSAYQKQGLGSALLQAALLRTMAAARIAGIRAVLLHAMSDDAKRFYARAGFHECPVDPMMMMITLAQVEKNLSRPARADDSEAALLWRTSPMCVVRASRLSVLRLSIRCAILR